MAKVKKFEGKEAAKRTNYSTNLEITAMPQEVFDRINEVSKWWIREVVGISTEFDGDSSKLNDTFTLRHSDNHYSKHKLIVLKPAKKVVWLVTDSRLNWIKGNKQEWTGTKMIFEITLKEGKTSLTFTHDGLHPQLECYSHCVNFWERVIKEWLFNFIVDSKAADGFDNNQTNLKMFKDHYRKIIRETTKKNLKNLVTQKLPIIFV